MKKLFVLVSLSFAATALADGPNPPVMGLPVQPHHPPVMGLPVPHPHPPVGLPMPHPTTGPVGLPNGIRVPDVCDNAEAFASAKASAEAFEAYYNSRRYVPVTPLSA